MSLNNGKGQAYLFMYCCTRWFFSWGIYLPSFFFNCNPLFFFSKNASKFSYETYNKTMEILFVWLLSYKTLHNTQSSVQTDSSLKQMGIDSQTAPADDPCCLRLDWQIMEAALPDAAPPDPFHWSLNPVNTEHC